MIIIKKTDKAVSSKLKSQHGFNLLELVVILAVIAIIAAIAVPRFINFNERANEELLDATICKLNDLEQLVFAEIKKTPNV